MAYLPSAYALNLIESKNLSFGKWLNLTLRLLSATLESFNDIANQNQTSQKL